MSLALTTQTVHTDLRTKRLYLIATPSGNYATGGDTVNLTAITPALGQLEGTVGYPGNIKDYSVISAPAGYVAKLIKGATLATWLLQVFQSAGVTPELAVGAGNPATNALGMAAASGATSLVSTDAATINANAIPAAGLSELPAAAYPAGVLAGTFMIEVEGPKGQL